MYVGIQQMEYGGLAARHLPALGAFTATGTPFSVAAGRLAFTHGLRGPAVGIPTPWQCDRTSSEGQGAQVCSVWYGLQVEKLL